MGFGRKRGAARENQQATLIPKKVDGLNFHVTGQREQPLQPAQVSPVKSSCGESGVFRKIVAGWPIVPFSIGSRRFSIADDEVIHKAR